MRPANAVEYERIAALRSSKRHAVRAAAYAWSALTCVLHCTPMRPSIPGTFAARLKAYVYLLRVITRLLASSPVEVMAWRKFLCESLA